MLYLGDSGTLAINPALKTNLAYNALRDFTPVTGLVNVPTVLVVPPSLPATTLQEFVALAKSKPGQLDFGSPGVGSIHHFTHEIFAERAGIKLQHVPFRSAGECTSYQARGGTAMPVVPETALVCVNGGYVNLAREATWWSEFTSQQACVDFIVGGGTVVPDEDPAVRIEITRLEGKWKLSQNHPEGRRRRVVRALAARPDEDSRAIAALMEEALP